MKRFSTLTKLLFSVLIVLGMVLPFFEFGHAATGLSVEIIAAPNLIVDSNVMSPSTNQPVVATVIGKFCNTSGSTLDDVVGYIGDYTGSGADFGTPGDYPDNTPGTISGGGVSTTYDGTYEFQHLGGTVDANRYIGSLQPGECSYQYWSFTYPKYANWNGGTDNIPAWGKHVQPGDDLWLEFDIWGNYPGESPTYATHRMTMRNEISAFANKIKPNGNPGGRWFNTSADVINPGETITTNGILYRLGNVNQGFDNDGDLLPDYNAWLQPFGDPAYDPTCFRLVATTGVLTVTRSGKPDLVIPFDDQLYFTDLPTDNTNVVGKVFYTFLALGGACSIPITPYQEVASGADNEKFNGDYGTGVPPIASFEPAVTVEKSGSPDRVSTSATLTYQIGFENTSSTAEAGLTLASGSGVNAPLVISDTIPSGTTYIYDSATFGLDYTYSGSGMNIVYLDSSTGQWTENQPAAASVAAIQWRLTDPLPTSGNNGSGYVQFAVTTPATEPSPPFIENCSDGRFGDGHPFAESCVTTMIEGDNSIGDFVWQDDDADGNQDAGESGIPGVAVSLYWDTDGGGTLDDNDVFIATQDTGSGGDYVFTQLPDGDYLVIVDSSDTDLPVGYVPTTAEVVFVDDLTGGTDPPPPITYADADFGFGPVLLFSKDLISADPAAEGATILYQISITNTRPGDGSAPGACLYPAWGTAIDTANSGTGQSGWQNNTNILDAPDSVYATSPFQGSAETVAVNTFSAGGSGTISRVYAVIPMLVTQPLAGTFEVNIIRGATTYQHIYDAATLSDGELLVDVTSDNAAGSASGWAWTDFNSSSTSTSIQLISRKSGNPPGYVEADALGYRVEVSDQICGNPDDTMNPVPLADTFDDTKLEFVSANPPVSSVSGGTLTWYNVGPIYGGQTKQISVRFLALEPPDTDSDGEPDPTTHENCAATSGGRMQDGAALNDASDCVTHGIDPGGQIGDFIWSDNDGDGIQDTGETGFPNVSVSLYDCGPDNTCRNSDDVLVNTTVTDLTGYYLFTGVRDTGRLYQVTVDTSALPDGAAWTNTADGGNNITIDYTDGVSSTDNFMGADFGYRYSNSNNATLTGSIWHDRDNSGTSTPSGSYEEWLEGIIVNLYPGTTCTGTPDYTVVTDANGYFFVDFANADIGEDYAVCVDTGSGPLATGTWNQTYDTDGIGTGSQDFVQVNVPDRSSYHVDFSYRRTDTYQIGDLVYVDWDGDGAYDSATEDGIPNVRVWLYADDGDGVLEVGSSDYLVSTTLTDADGFYLFSNAVPGDYLVVLDSSTLSSGYRQTQDPDEAGVCATCDDRGFLPDFAANDLTQDFGYLPVGTSSIGDLVWADLDADGLLDTGEAGISDITVNLYRDSDNDSVIDSGDALMATTVTDANGEYLFVNLVAGNYLVQVDTADTDLPGGYVLTTRRKVFDATVVEPDVISNNPHDVKGRAADNSLLSLGTGEAYLTADFGFAPGGAIGDFIWQDNDGDGLQDQYEIGISGVDLTLYCDSDGDGNADDTCGTDTTDADGYYEFTNLPGGEYRVVVTSVPAGYTLTGDPDAYGLGGVLSPPCDPGDTVNYASCDGEYLIYLYGGRSDRTADFGYQPEGVIGDWVWLDLDGDGLQDPGEQGIDGVVITLIGGVSYTTTTDLDGYYSFGNVADGTYTVEVDTSTLPTGLVQTYDRDGGGDGQASVEISATAGRTQLDVDFGYRYNADGSISGTVFFDGLNDGGIYDGGTDDAGYGSVPVYLYDNSGSQIATTYTASNGSYSFGHLPDGTFYVSINTESTQFRNLSQTYEPDLSASARCGDGGEPACDNYAPATVVSGSDTPDQDFGFFANMDLGDLLNYRYVTTLDSEGPSHVIGNLYMGTSVDADPDGQENLEATGDDNDGNDDDDGLVRVSTDTWVGDATVHITVTVTSNTGPDNGYLVGWFDWDDSGTFDPGEMVEFGTLATGVHLLDLTIPTGWTIDDVSYYLKVRFRLFDSDPGTPIPTGSVINGEVEDYRWQFSPTAVTLTDFSVGSDPMRLRLAIVTALLLLGTGIFFLLKGRRQKAAIRVWKDKP